MATLSISDKNFDYLCALSDVARFIKSSSGTPEDTLEALIFCGEAAEQKFDHMLETYAKLRQKTFNADPSGN